LQGLPLQLVSFIGLTEEYAKSIRLYNSFTGLNFEVREDTINSHNSAAEISDELSALIAEHNRADNILYDQGVSLSNERSKLVKSGKDWCFSFIDRLDENGVAGVYFSLPAKFDYRDISVEVESTGQVLQQKF
jgi:hypothetical protein